MIQKMIQKMMMMHHLCRPTLDHRRTRSSRTRPSPRPRRTHASSSAPFAVAFAFAVAVAFAHPHPCPHISIPRAPTRRPTDSVDVSTTIDVWDRSDRSERWMDGWMDHRVIFTGRDSTCMGHARIARAREREKSSESLLDRYAVVQYASLSLYTQTPRTPIRHARVVVVARSRALSLLSHDSWMSPRVSRPPATRGPAHADARLPHDARTHHDFRRRRHEDDDESDVLLFARLSRRVDHRKQRCRSEAGASDARENERAAGRMECARAGWRAGVVVNGDRAREGRRARGDDDAERWMRGNNFFLKVSRGSRRGRARGDVDGGRGRRIDRAIATGPAYPREGW